MTTLNLCQEYTGPRSRRYVYGWRCRHVKTWRGMLPASLLVEWRVSDGLVPYADAVAFMEARADAIATGAAGELIWLLEHPPLYTAGTSAREGDLLEARFPVHKSGRGGQFTYHGPGQRIAYVMLDLNRRTPICGLSSARWRRGSSPHWRLSMLRVSGGPIALGSGSRGRLSRVERARDRRGQDRGDRIRVRRWVSFHGIALNVAPDLTHFAGIVPCGISAAHFGVTSLHDLGVLAGMGEVDAALRTTFAPIFGKTEQLRRGNFIAVSTLRTASIPPFGSIRRSSG